MVSKCEYYVSYVRIGVNIEIDSIKKVSMPCTKHLLVIMNIIINIKKSRMRLAKNLITFIYNC